jgi:hypothetical protein
VILAFARDHEYVVVSEDTDFGELLARQRSAAPSVPAGEHRGDCWHVRIDRVRPRSRAPTPNRPGVTSTPGDSAVTEWALQGSSRPLPDPDSSAIRLKSG